MVFGSSPDRRALVNGDAIRRRPDGSPEWPEFPRAMYEGGRLYEVIWKGETVVTVTSRGLNEDEFDLIVRTLEPAAE